MKPNAPRATVMIPLLRQRDDWLAECVRSALEQSVPCEVLVVTSPLTPQSNLAVLGDLAGRHENLRLTRRPEGARFAAALNHGLSQAACERVGLLLSDDWLDRRCLEACLQHQADMVSTGLTIHGGARRRVDGHRFRRTRAAYDALPTLERKAHYLGHFLLLRRDVVLAAGGLDETVGDSPGVDDYHLVWTLLERGASVAIVEEALYRYRDHDGERLTNRDASSMWSTMQRILAKHQLGPTRRAELLVWHSRWFGQPLSASFASARRDAEHRWASAVRWEVPWGRGRALLVHGDGKRTVVDASLAALLRSCTAPRTLHEHALFLVARAGGRLEDHVEMERALRAARRKGLLVPEAALRRRPGANPVPTNTEAT